MFSKALKTYAADEARNYKKLRSYAIKMGIENKVDDILESYEQRQNDGFDQKEV